ncbi:MAG TPA: branched-chain amino acid ABC transporter substrate-binding protein [Candidatus Lustribacter sp.]
MFRSDFLAGLGATSVAAAAPYQPQITPSISIALCAPLSGPARAIGERLSKGVQGAIQYSNELAGSLQRTFAMRPFDDQNTAANAAIASSFATGDSTVIAAIGHVSSDATLQGIANYGPAQLPLLVPVCTDDRITATQYHCVFRLPTKDSFEGQIFARSVNAQFKPKLPYVFVQDADYGADVANGFLSEMTARKVAAQYQQFPYANANFGAVVDKALAAAPDYAFLAGVVGDMGPIVGVLRSKGYTGPIGASQGFFDPGALKLGAAANGMMVSTSMPYLPFAPSTLRLRQEFQTHFGALDPVAAFGYAAAQIIISAVNRTNAAGRGATVTAIAQGVPIDTMTGTYSFTGFGDALQPQLYYYTLKDGAFTYLKQAHPSTFMIK